MPESLNTAIELSKKTNPDLIIISTGHTLYKCESTVKKLMGIPPTKIYDTIGLFNSIQISALRSRHKVSIRKRRYLINYLVDLVICTFILDFRFHKPKQ